MGNHCANCHLGLRGGSPMSDAERIALKFVRDEEMRMEIAFIQEQMDALAKKLDDLDLVPQVLKHELRRSFRP